MKKSNTICLLDLYRSDGDSEFHRAGCTTCLTLEKRCSVLLYKVRIWCGALAALDVGIDVVCNRLLDPLRRDSPLETSTRAVTGPGSTQFIENVLVHMIVISIHHGNDFIEITENRVLPFD